MTSFTQRRFTHSITRTLTGVAVASVLIASPAHADPLSPEDLSLAKNATSSFLSRSATNMQLRHFSVTSDLESTASIGASERVETLLIETLEPSKDAPPNSPTLAVAYLYNYEDDKLTRLSIDPATGSTRVLSREYGVQLPLIDSEISNALVLAFNDEETRTQLDAQFLQITGEALVNSSQLHVKAFAFHADTAPGTLLPASQTCGMQRCAQLMLYTHDNTAFEFMPIVNLSEQLVTELMGVNQ